MITRQIIVLNTSETCQQMINDIVKTFIQKIHTCTQMEKTDCVPYKFPDMLVTLSKNSTGVDET